MATNGDGQGAQQTVEQPGTKAEAEMRSAVIDADRKREEFEEWRADKARRERTSEAATAKAEAEAAAARSDMWAGLKDVELGKTEVSGDGVIYGSSLSLAALRAAGEKVAEAITQKMKTPSVLVTSEVDLAGAEAAYHAVRSGIGQLRRAADDLLKATIPVQEFMALTSIASAAAQIAPAVLRALSAVRAMSVNATPADDLAAATAVVGAMLDKSTDNKPVKVWHDDFRVLPNASPLESSLKELSTKMYQLLRRGETIDGAPKETIKSFVAAVETFLNDISKVPEGARRSALMNARIREALHSTETKYVLLVKGVTGTASQLVNDRPFWLNDKFSVLATAGINYMLVEKKSGRAVAAGSESGAAWVHGVIGKRLEIGKAVQA